MIELVMVIVILGILAAMVLPRFIDLQVKAKESASKGALGAIRAAVAVTYADNSVNNVTPAIPAVLTPVMFQDQKIPTEPISNSSAITYSDTTEGVSNGWVYDPATGRVWVARDPTW